MEILQRINNGFKISEFACTWEELGVTLRDVETIMGFFEEPAHEPFQELMARAFEEAPSLVRVKAGYRKTSDFQMLPGTRQIKAEGQLFSPGSIIFSQMRNASELLFFVSTAGENITNRSREVNREGDILYAYVLDSLGSVVAEKAVDKMMETLEEEALLNGWHISESYSPGYCNWDVAEQQKLFQFFPSNFCGVTLSPSSLMHPVKSISGIIGIGPSQSRNGYRCLVCHDKNCIYGRIRRQNHITSRH